MSLLSASLIYLEQTFQNRADDFGRQMAKATEQFESRYAEIAKATDAKFSKMFKLLRTIYQATHGPDNDGNNPDPQSRLEFIQGVIDDTSNEFISPLAQTHLWFGNIPLGKISFIDYRQVLM